MEERFVPFVVGVAIAGFAFVASYDSLDPAAVIARLSGGRVPTIDSNGPSIRRANEFGGNDTIDVAAPRLYFSKEVGDDLISRLPPGKFISLQSVGGEEDHAIVNQYQEYLQNKGFRVQRVMIRMMVPPPRHKIALGDPSDAQMEIIIAPSAQ